MRLSEEQKQQLESSLPSSAVVRQQLVQYLEATGMSPSEFSDACGYSPNAIRYFLRDEYNIIADSDLLIRQRISEFMQAHPVAPDTKASGELYDTEDYRLLRKYFYLALNRHRAYVVQADCGVGKTFLTKHLIAELNRREISLSGSGRRAYFVRASGTMTATQLLKEIALAAGVSSQGDSRRVLRALRRSFIGRSVLIVIDEAQQLRISALEAVRELLDEPPYCGLLVIGSHELGRMFTQHAVELEQWNSRAPAQRTLAGLTDNEARLIISEELPNATEAVIRDILAGCRVSHLHAKSKYVSARRLFTTIEDIKADDSEDEANA